MISKTQRFKCLVEIQDEIVSTFKGFLSGNEVIGYADPAANNNLGDQLLWAGSNKLFMRFGKHPILHCGGSQTKNIITPCLNMADEIKKTLGDGKGILWYNPGGNWGNLYRHVQDGRLGVWKMAHDLGIPFISGPQSICYQGEAKATYKDDAFIAQYGTKKDLLTFRQHNSFLFALDHYNATTVRESPDMAFMLGPQMPNRAAKFDVFLMVRSDSESSLGRWDQGWDNHDKICRGIVLEGYTCGVGDWGIGNHINRQRVIVNGEPAHGTYADIGLQIALTTVSIGEVVISDRLHGVLLSFLAGKTVIYIDNTYKKLSNVLHTAFRNKKQCSNTEDMGVYDTVVDVDKIVEKALDVLRKKGTKINYEQRAREKQERDETNQREIEAEINRNHAQDAGRIPSEVALPVADAPLDPNTGKGEQAVVAAENVNVPESVSEGVTSSVEQKAAEVRNGVQAVTPAKKDSDSDLRRRTNSLRS